MLSDNWKREEVITHKIIIVSGCDEILIRMEELSTVMHTLYTSVQYIHYSNKKYVYVWLSVFIEIAKPVLSVRIIGKVNEILCNNFLRTTSALSRYLCDDSATSQFNLKILLIVHHCCLPGAGT